MAAQKVCRLHEETSWCNWNGIPLKSPNAVVDAETMAEGKIIPDLEELSFRDPTLFHTGEIHKHIQEWQMIVGRKRLGRWLWSG